MQKLTFEECIDEINTEINKRKSKWTLTAISWMDFDDVAQLLRIHISQKWDQYNPEKALVPWVNVIISNQLINLMRNVYGNYTRPCLRCTANEGDDLCRIYVKQCVDCPLYAKWIKTKKSAYDSKLPVTLENHEQEVYSLKENSLDLDKASKNLHYKMQQILKPKEWNVYKCLYIEQKDEEDAMRFLGYISNEKSRMPGYRQIKNIKKTIIEKVKKVLADGEIELV